MQKKLSFIAVAAILGLSACDSGSDLERAMVVAAMRMEREMEWVFMLFRECADVLEDGFELFGGVAIVKLGKRSLAIGGVGGHDRPGP